jgi:hypothetical protein
MDHDQGDYTDQINYADQDKHGPPVCSDTIELSAKDVGSRVISSTTNAVSPEMMSTRDVMSPVELSARNDDSLVELH